MHQFQETPALTAKYGDWWETAGWKFALLFGLLEVKWSCDLNPSPNSQKWPFSHFRMGKLLFLARFSDYPNPWPIFAKNRPKSLILEQRGLTFFARENPGDGFQPEPTFCARLFSKRSKNTGFACVSCARFSRFSPKIAVFGEKHENRKRGKFLIFLFGKFSKNFENFLKIFQKIWKIFKFCENFENFAREKLQ